MKKSEMIKLVAKSVTASVQKKEKGSAISEMVASAIVEAVNEAAEPAVAVPSGFADPKKMGYYIERSLGEVRQIIDDANFELDDILSDAKSTIKDIRFPEEGGAVVVITKALSVDNEGDHSKIGPVFGRFSLRDEMAKFTTYSLDLPSVASPTVTMTVTIRLPQVFVEEFLEATSFEKRTSIIQKYVNDIIKAQLD